MMANVSTAARDNFFSIVFSCVIKLASFGDVLKDHLSFIQTKLNPRSEYSSCNFFNDLGTLVFFEILLSIVSTSNGSAAAKIIASICLSRSLNLDGNFTILSFETFFFFNH